MTLSAEPTPRTVNYYWCEDISVYSSVEANLLKPHILKCVPPPVHAPVLCTLARGLNPREWL